MSNKFFLLFLASIIAAFFSTNCKCQDSIWVPFNGPLAGIVNGIPITRSDYIDAYLASEQSIYDEIEYNLTNIDFIRPHFRAWDGLINEAIIQSEIVRRGITISDSLLQISFENDPPEYLINEFSDSDGYFYKDEFLEAIHDRENDSIVQVIKANYRKQLLKQRLMMALDTIIINEDELSNIYDNAGPELVVEYLKVYPDVNLDTLLDQVTEAQMATLYEAKKKNFKHMEHRLIDIVSFNDVFTSEDSLKLQHKLEAAKKLLKKAPLDKSEETVIALTDYHGSSPYPLEPVRWLAPDQWSNYFEDINEAERTKTGEVYSIQHNNASGRVSRVLEINDLGEECYWVRSTSVGSDEFDIDTTREIALKIFEEIKSGTDTKDLKKKYQQYHIFDDYYWVGENSLKHIEANIKDAKPNEVLPPYRDYNRYQIYQFFRKTRKQLKLAVAEIDLQVTPAHFDAVCSKANIFSSLSKRMGFEQTAKGLNYEIRQLQFPIGKNEDRFKGNLGTWLFSAKVGDVSEASMLKEGQIWVARLREIIPEGYYPIDSVRKALQMGVAIEKCLQLAYVKADSLRKVIISNNTSKLADYSDSSVIFEQDSVYISKDSNGYTYFNNDAIPNSLLKKVTALLPDEISEPIKGINYYMLLKLTTMNVMSKYHFLSLKDEIKETNLAQRRKRHITKWLSKEREKAKIEDFRIIR